MHGMCSFLLYIVYTVHLPRNFKLSCVVNPVWGLRGKDTHSSEARLYDNCARIARNHYENVCKLTVQDIF